MRFVDLVLVAGGALLFAGAAHEIDIVLALHSSEDADRALFARVVEHPPGHFGLIYLKRELEVPGMRVYEACASHAPRPAAPADYRVCAQIDRTADGARIAHVRRFALHRRRT